MNDGRKLSGGKLPWALQNHRQYDGRMHKHSRTVEINTHLVETHKIRTRVLSSTRFNTIKATVISEQ